RQVAPHETKDRVRLRLDVVVVPLRHPDPREDEEGAEDVEDPVETLDEEGARADHGAAHDEGAEDPPEQHAVLVLLRDAEVPEDQDEDEDVVDAERLLDQVACEELEPGVGAPEVVDPRAEGERQDHPEDAPDRRLPDADLVGFAVEDEEVEGEERQDDRVEAGPEPETAHWRLPRPGARERDAARPAPRRISSRCSPPLTDAPRRSWTRRD